MKGVVFDFFGTLTNPAIEHRRREVWDTTADVLGVPSEVFSLAMTSAFTERATGVLGGTAQMLREVAWRCGVDPTSAEITAAAATHHAGAELLHAPRDGALDVLSELRARGFKLALLSDCSSELCETWDRTPYGPLFDGTVFSWAVGYRKPDPRGYRAAAEALGLCATECWFVGDGGSRELLGAKSVGMTPVLVANTAHPEHAQFRDDPDAFFPAHVVDDLVDVPLLLGWPGERDG